jgi:hypothetical protein
LCAFCSCIRSKIPVRSLFGFGCYRCLQQFSFFCVLLSDPEFCSRCQGFFVCAAGDLPPYLDLVFCPTVDFANSCFPLQARQVALGPTPQSRQASRFSPIFSSHDSEPPGPVFFSSPSASLEFCFFCLRFFVLGLGSFSTRFGLGSATGFRFRCRSLREFSFCSFLLGSELFSPPGSENRHRLISLACFFWSRGRIHFPLLLVVSCHQISLCAPIFLREKTSFLDLRFLLAAPARSARQLSQGPVFGTQDFSFLVFNAAGLSSRSICDLCLPLASSAPVEPKSSFSAPSGSSCSAVPCFRFSLESLS